jgi:hypothetical protein
MTRRSWGCESRPATSRKARKHERWHRNDLERSGAYVSVWRSVFERRAPPSIAAVEEQIGTRIGTGNVIRELTDEALAALPHAYREAATTTG